MFPDLEKSRQREHTASDKYTISLALVLRSGRAYLERGTAKERRQGIPIALEAAGNA